MTSRSVNPVRRILELLAYERKDITAIYFYATFSGLVQLSLPLGIQSIISYVMGGSISTSLVLLIILVVGGVAIQGLLQVNQLKIIEKIQQQLFVRYSFLYAYHLPAVNLREVDAYYMPEQVNRFFDTVSLQKGLSKLLIDIPTASIQILFGLILLSLYHPIFIFFSISLITILFLLLRYTGNKGLSTSLEESNHKYRVAGWLEEMARTITSFKFSRNPSLHLHKTDERVASYLGARTSHFRILLVQYWSLIAFKVIITAAMLIVGCFLLLEQQLNIGQFIAAEIVIIIVIAAAEKFINSLENVYDVLTSVEKLSKVIEMEKEHSGQQVFHAEDSKAVSVEVSDLSFSYQPAQPVLKHISFTLQPGEKLCLMGAQGAGKSSLLRVLTGSYQPFDGSIRLNGIPVNHYDLRSLRGHTGVMLHDSDIFEGSLMENITMGNENISLEWLKALSQITGLKAYVDSLPEGWMTKLNPSGQRLPGKVIHRILLLRAIVDKPPFLLLEEPWLGLDNESVKSIRDFLLQEFSGSTIIVSSNSIEFAKQCDKVIYLKDGKLKYEGPWKDELTESINA